MRFRVALTFSTFVILPLILNGCATPGPGTTAPSITLPTVKLERIDYGSLGSCDIVYIMTNNFSFTYGMHGNVFMTDSAGNTLGQKTLIFPTTLPGKSSQDVTRFHHNQIAGNSCKSAKTLVFKGTVCTNVDSGQYLSQDLCKRIAVTSTINN